MTKHRRPLSALALAVALLAPVLQSSPAEAAWCIVPGEFRTINDPLNGHHACYSVTNTPVAGAPQLCWVTYYLQELVDVGTDVYAAQLRTNDGGQGWSGVRLSAKNSAAFEVKSGYHLATLTGTQVCSDFGNPTSAQIKFTHPGNSGWKYVPVDWKP